MNLTTKLKNSEVAWLGQIPVHWTVVQSRRLFSERNERAEPSDEQLTVSQKHGLLTQRQFMEIEGRRIVQVIKGHDILKRAMAGDFVMSMRSFQGGLEYSGLTGSVSSAYVPLTPIKWVRPPFFRYLFKSVAYIQALQATSDLVRDGQALRFENFSKVPLPVVPFAEQDLIADFLDRATARIDTLIAKKTRFIELLREKRQALITHAVTKGLDATVPMKDSGVEWIGSVPAHWLVCRLRDITRSITTGPFGTALSSGDYVSGGVPVINPSHLCESGFAPEEAVSVSESKATQLDYWRVTPGDIVTARRGELGRSAIVTAQQDGWICGTGSLRIRPDVTMVSSEYIHALMYSRATRSWLDYQSVGSTMPNLNEALLGNLPVALPPNIPEQDAVTSRIASMKQKIDDLVANTERSIALLSEHRTALISAAVTGKIDLRESA